MSVRCARVSTPEPMQCDTLPQASCDRLFAEVANGIQTERSGLVDVLPRTAFLYSIENSSLTRVLLSYAHLESAGYGHGSAPIDQARNAFPHSRNGAPDEFRR